MRNGYLIALGLLAWVLFGGGAAFTAIGLLTSSHNGNLLTGSLLVVTGVWALGIGTVLVLVWLATSAVVAEIRRSRV